MLKLHCLPFLTTLQHGIHAADIAAISFPLARIAFGCCKVGRRTHIGARVKLFPSTFLAFSVLDSFSIFERAGTGLLSILLSPLVRHYTVTDIDALIPLISKNLVLNSLLRDKGSGHFTGDTITVEALDWIALHKAPASSRRTLFPYAPIDLLLVVDCIYHPSLLPALVETIDYLATPNYTAVLVVVELRAEDVVRDFLELWSGAGEGCWEIWHAQNVMDGPYAVWLGWKKLPNK